MLNIQKYNIRGTEINKLQFSEIEDYLEEKGLNVYEVYLLLSDGCSDWIYVSNGFIAGLQNENEDKEWHHYFKKEEDGTFVAGKMMFK